MCKDDHKFQSFKSHESKNPKHIAIEDDKKERQNKAFKICLK